MKRFEYNSLNIALFASIYLAISIYVYAEPKALVAKMTVRQIMALFDVFYIILGTIGFLIITRNLKSGDNDRKALSQLVWHFAFISIWYLKYAVLYYLKFRS